MSQDVNAQTTNVELVLAGRDRQRYVFCLYVTGMTPRSLSAVAAMKALCEERLADRYELQVINLAEHPELAREKNIIAAPTLIRELPPPLQRLVGSLSNRSRVLTMLQ